MYTVGGRGLPRWGGVVTVFSFSRSPFTLLLESERAREGEARASCMRPEQLHGWWGIKKNNLGVFTENGGEKKKYRCKCQTNKLNAQLGHFTVIFPSRLFSFIINDVFFFCCFSEGEASSFFPLALCVYFDDARRTFFSSSSFLFSFEDDFGVSGSGTWLLWSLRSSSKLFFYSNLPPSASILEGYFMSNAQLTRLRTQWLSIVIFFFPLHFRLASAHSRKRGSPSRSTHLVPSSSVGRGDSVLLVS